MQSMAVILKSNPRGLTVELPDSLPFEELLEAVREKFRQSAAFFGKVSLALTFQGRTLSTEQEAQLIEAVVENSSIEVLCLVDEEAKTEERFREVQEEAPDKKNAEDFFYRGTLHTNESLKSDQSVVVLGDVNPGAFVSSAGSIVVLGCCMGTLIAGAEGDNSCFIAALTLKPAMVKIGSHAARSAIVKKEDTGEYPLDPQMIYVKGEHLQFKPIDKDSLQDYLADEGESLTDIRS